MELVLEKLAACADRLDRQGLKEEANLIDQAIVSLAQTGMGFQALKTPEEKARDRMLMEGKSDEKVYQKYLVEERAKQEVAREPEPQVQPQKAKVQSKIILPYTKEQLIRSVQQNPQQEALIRKRLVPALNQAIGGPDIPGVSLVDVYSKAQLNKLLSDAETFGLIKKEEGLLNRWFGQ